MSATISIANGDRKAVDQLDHESNAMSRTSDNPAQSSQATPIRVHRNSERLQINFIEPYPQVTSNVVQHWRHAVGYSDKEIAYDNVGLIPVEQGTEQKNRKICGLKRRNFVIVAVLVAVIIIGAAVGGGVGGYLANKPPTPTTSTAATPTSTLVNPVTSGATGLAAPPCADAKPITPSAPHAVPLVSNPYLAPGATFNITCRRGVPPAGGFDGNPINDISRSIEYTFEACMEKCARDQRCGGVGYGANLTYMVADKGGNCLLKDGRWDAVEKKGEWFASAVKI